jgi:hypothetical protein
MGNNRRASNFVRQGTVEVETREFGTQTISTGEIQVLKVYYEDEEAEQQQQLQKQQKKVEMNGERKNGTGINGNHQQQQHLNCGGK